MPGTPVSITRMEAEPWTECLLSDGSVIRLRVSIYEATRVDNAYENDGTPVYVVKWGILQHTLAPDSMKKTPNEAR
ncbi:MAG: hypothetical protein WCB99_14455 [Candidatus Cybelea sp.]